MLQNPCKTLGFKKNMVYKIPPGGGGKPYPASGLDISPCNFTSSHPANHATCNYKVYQRQWTGNRANQKCLFIDYIIIIFITRRRVWE